MDNLLGSTGMLAGITPILNALLALPSPTPEQQASIVSLKNIIIQLNGDIT